MFGYSEWDIFEGIQKILMASMVVISSVWLAYTIGAPPKKK